MKDEKVITLRQPDLDEILFFKGGNGFDSDCGIKIWAIRPSPEARFPTRYVVIATQLAGDGHGVSVTNAAEIIATEVMKSFLPGADPESMVFIEHYPPRGGIGSRLAETFDLVRLKYDGQRFRLDTSRGNGWKHLTETELRDLGVLPTLEQGTKSAT